MTNSTLSKCSHLFYDFDGVMTDNTVIMDEHGIESVRVNRSDGLAISALKKMGFAQAIVSTEKNNVVSMRAEKLGILCMQGLEDKKSVLLDYCIDSSINPELCVFVGNDINDLEVMNSVGYPVCPSDAHSKIISISRIVLNTKGGNGVIRELLDLITNKQK
jgi:3-deoxy-D-manno-octulosonate 8-phosphate phosphatase (KDO 8-P phosphatase)